MGGPFIFIIGAWILMAIPIQILKAVAIILYLPVYKLMELFGYEE